MRDRAVCDFLSMYHHGMHPDGPVVVRRGRGMAGASAAARTQGGAAGEDITVDDLRRQEIWRELTILVRVRPDADVFPVGNDYDGKGQPTIGANCLSANKGGLWFTLADCIASKLHTGKAPVVLEALRFQPGPLQVDLREIDLPGDAGKIDREIAGLLQGTHRAPTGHKAAT